MADGAALLSSLAMGLRVFVKVAGDNRWHERLLLAKRSTQKWGGSSDTSVTIEDFGEHDGMAILGTQGGLPRSVRGQVLLRFDEDELERRSEELRDEGLALVAAEAAVPSHWHRLRPGQDASSEAARCTGPAIGRGRGS